MFQVALKAFLQDRKRQFDTILFYSSNKTGINPNWLQQFTGGQKVKLGQWNIVSVFHTAQ